MWNFNAVLQNSVPARPSLPTASRFSTGECHINVHVGHFNALITFWKLVDHCGLALSRPTSLYRRLEWLWSCRPVLCVFRQEFGKCIDFWFLHVFFAFLLQTLSFWAPDVCSFWLSWRKFVAKIEIFWKKKHIEAWKMKDPAWWYNIVEEWILAYII